MSADAATATPSLVDWDTAVATAARLVKPGPKVTPQEAQHIVEDLRRLAGEAEEHVRGFTGLVSVGDPGRVMVVDRPGWAAANVQGFQVLLGPVVVILTPSLDKVIAKILFTPDSQERVRVYTDVLKKIRDKSSWEEKPKEKR